MGTIYLVDYYANNLKSHMHKASVTMKLLTTAIAVLLIITTHSVTLLIIDFALTLIFIGFSNLPVLRILRWSLYPAFFASFFAISQLPYSLITPLITIFRAVDAALVMLLLINTTPYPQIFFMLSKISRTLGNIAFLTYRFFFIFIEQAEKRFTTLKVRGGLAGGLTRTIKNISHFIGSLFLVFVDISEETYYATKTRGYSGIISCRPGPWMKINSHDWMPFTLLTFLTLIIIVYWLFGFSGGLI